MVTLRTAVLTASVALASAAAAQEAYELNDNEVAAIQRAVTLQLKDPDSAKFGPIKAVPFPGVKEGGVILACGLVNAKNGFGGYAGETPFVGVLATYRQTGEAEFVVRQIAGTETDSATVISYCKSQGIR
ncbi:hypothetical protein [Mesorhizobium sp. M1E.F.Ca.ET.041.01.1.1]|uniref:hypothetical protein n=1 Tax=Mesorhizobium sp. M1E.F.Ca.ET.041.01.1.1 TaxID=2496759 RepID=UPI000FCC524F|nr:hypothetical protein [Mesorhizobium sp. M1E.F.Ca.ET.041.01.1.1]RUW24954.1 hypothetical protein EOA38_28515 [Mesorhizobium sp. M1E.F.Ca.ET.041.01.1.1]RWD92382.1 MAG: hypothetical protein EOS38_00685 [Mesorhizobium sp.]